MVIFFFVIGSLSALILGHEAGHFAAAKVFGLKVDEFGFGFPPRAFAKKIGDTEYSLNWLPFGGFVRIAGEEDGMGADAPEVEGASAAEKHRMFFTQPAWKKSVIVLAGVFVNFLIGWFLISVILMIGVPKALIVSGVEPNSPAAQVGIEPGDILKSYTFSKDFIAFVDAHRGIATELAVVRGGKEMHFLVIPRVTTNPNEGAVGVFLTEGGEDRVSFFSAIGEGLRRAAAISALTFQSFYDLIKTLFTKGALLPGVVGPVGIISVAEEAGRVGLIYLFQLVSLISLNLAVVNLIPFPALDGGRFLMVLIEKIKGKPLSKRTESAVNTVGFAFLVILMIALTVRDVGNLF